MKDFAARSKAKAKSQRREPVDYSPRIIPMNERKWIDIEPGNSSLFAYEISKKVIQLLRHSQIVQREEDGAVQFWRIKNYLQSQFLQIPFFGLTIVGKHAWQQEEEQKGDISNAMMIQEQLFISELFKDIQDATLLILHYRTIQSGFFQHFYHIGCAFNLHSIINNGLIPGGQNSSKRQTVFFLPIDPRDKGHKDPENIDFSVPRRAQYLHSVWKKHQDAVSWVGVDLAIRKGLAFYQTRSNAIILQGTLPACCVPKVVRLKTGEVSYEKAYMSPRPPPKISLRHDWTKEVVSEVARQPREKVARQPRGEFSRQANFFQTTQPIPKPICDRSGQPDITPSVIKAQTNLSGEIRGEQTHDRSGQPDKHNVALQDAPEVHRESTTLNTDNELIRERKEEDMDFKIPGLPRSTVKQLQSASVRELIQKIENHPDRHALQRDLQQSQSFDPFSQESKQMIHEVGNIELCELLDMEHKTQCKVCLSYWDIGIVHCTCGHFLRKGTEEKKKFVQYTMDLLSISNY